MNQVSDATNAAYTFLKLFYCQAKFQLAVHWTEISLKFDYYHPTTHTQPTPPTPPEK